jgi:hypothetical protein
VTSLQLLFDLAPLENPHAAQPLPPWMLEGFRRLASADDVKRAVPRAPPRI